MEPGFKLGSYEVVSAVGAGGMGEVYRARDPKLGREVAIKVLPREMDNDPDRVARFHREARALATLQHPNIASIYGFEQDGNIHFLVMEMVEGQDLSVLLSAGALGTREAVAIAVQIAEGLAAAHEVGIVHRDLKPANIKIGVEGEVKILDFGLARAYAGESVAGDDILSSPTVTAMTQAGVILGTAAYMSPEQARGEAVDQRADLWAFGVILFEMLTGTRFFAGDTVSDTLAKVLRDEINWDLLPDSTPANVRRVLRRCLERKLKDRQRSASDARLALLETEHAKQDETPAKKRSVALPIALAVIAAVTLVMIAWMFRPSAIAPGFDLPTHLSLALPEGTQLVSRDLLPLGSPQTALAISDDGRLIVAAIERDGATWLYRRFLDQTEGEILDETRGSYSPQISPDGEWISFMQDSRLMKIGVRGSRATRLAELPNTFGHTWVSNDEIIVARAEGKELVWIDAEGGRAEPIETEDRWHQFFWPSRVPDRKAVIFSSLRDVGSDGERDRDLVSLMDLETNQRTSLGVGGTMPRLLRGGTLLMIRRGQLMGVPFDIERPAAELRPSVALDGVLVETWIGHYAVSENGTMVYAPGEWLLGNELVWDDGRGGIEPLGFPLTQYGDYELSPDGRRLAIGVGNFAESRIWIYDLERGSRRMLAPDDHGLLLTWSPDGERVVYGSMSDETWQLKVATVGSTSPPSVLYQSDQQLSSYTWHRESGLLFNIGTDLFRMDPDQPGEIEELVVTEGTEWGPDISPDGRWFAYTSDESGRYEVYARAFGSDRSFPVSLDGGEEPIYSVDGKTIYYRNGNRFYATPILEASTDGTRFRAGRPEVVVEGAYANVFGLSYDIGPDGRLLVLRTDGGTERPSHLNVILNWKPDLSD
ncbi:MAG: protein kinase [Holophagae bacterium]